jgi:hypothetical protein
MLANELADIGVEEVQIGTRVVEFTGNLATVYKANLYWPQAPFGSAGMATSFVLMLNFKTSASSHQPSIETKCSTNWETLWSFLRELPGRIPMSNTTTLPME